MGVQLSELARQIVGHSVTTHCRRDEASTRPERGQGTAVEIVQDSVREKLTEAQRHDYIYVARNRTRLERISTNEVETGMATRQIAGQRERLGVDVDTDEPRALVTNRVAAAHRLGNIEEIPRNTARNRHDGQVAVGG